MKLQNECKRIEMYVSENVVWIGEKEEENMVRKRFEGAERGGWRRDTTSRLHSSELRRKGRIKLNLNKHGKLDT